MPTTKTKPKTRPRAPSPELRPASRSSWSGQLKLPDFHLPVKAYPAVVVSRTSPLCQIHAGCGEPIEYQKHCPIHGRVPAAEIAKAYPYAAGNRLPLQESDLARLAPADEKTIALEQFVTPDPFDWTLFSGRSYYLAPAHPAAGLPFQAFTAALEKAKVWGVGQMVLSGRRQLLAVSACDQQLLLYLLHWPAQRRGCPAFPSVANADALPLVRALEKTIGKAKGPVRWEQYADDWDQRLSSLVQSMVAALTAPFAKKKPSRRRATPGRTRPAASK
ncbi:Ku protein [Lignipirellula cremea]|uniref:Putative DNA repair protein YkoV n=1 Tax=Lignipirellula cremea TaxID=2528010 RepID=A0A518DKH6_9BACT|nr:Ku protein [Lignipirellula cremea]QDU92331.1 putative DNA repair protein YkoV [Lignipirellula cremea]